LLSNSNCVTITVVFVLTTLLIVDDKVKLIFAFIISEVVAFSGLIVSSGTIEKK
jgi:hypothetical protein